MPTNTKQQLCIKPTGFLVKHEKFQTFFNDYAIASEQNMYSIMGSGICAVMLLFNMSASFAAHDK